MTAVRSPSSYNLIGEASIVDGHEKEKGVKTRRGKEHEGFDSRLPRFKGP